MAAGPIIDPEQFLHDQLAQASPDLMRELLQTFINSLGRSVTVSGTSRRVQFASKVISDSPQGRDLPF